MSPDLNTAIQSFSAKLKPHQGTDNFDRLNLFAKSKTSGVTISGYMGDPAVTDEVKLALLMELTDIIDAGKWDQLPMTPKGQVDRVATTPAAATVKPAPSRPAPAIVVMPSATPDAVPTPTVVATPPSSVAEVAPPPIADPMTAAMVKMLMPHILAAMPKPVAPPAPSSTPYAANVNVIRTVIHEEIAIFFEALARGIRNPVKKGDS